MQEYICHTYRGKWKFYAEAILMQCMLPCIIAIWMERNLLK